MKLIYLLTVMFTICSLPARGDGHGTIRETETEIIVEYTGTGDDAKASIVHNEELTKEEQQRIKEEQERVIEAKRKEDVDRQNNKRAARRPQRAED